MFFYYLLANGSSFMLNTIIQMNVCHTEHWFKLSFHVIQKMYFWNLVAQCQTIWLFIRDRQTNLTLLLI